MRKDFGSKTYLYPMPVLIIGTYNEAGTANAMNAAWGGISDFDKIAIALSNHKTTDNLKQTKSFTVSVGTTSMVEACDYVGIVSGNKIPDKVSRAGLHAIKSKYVNAPIFKELPLALECEVISFDEKSEILTGKIINVSADEEILTDGNIDVKKLRPITYDPVNHYYIELGNIVGKAFEVGKKFN